MARKKTRIETLHGDRREDEYFWLREKEDPEVIAHLEKENRHAGELLAPTKPLQEKLYKEMLGRIKETDLSAPYRKGAHWYYHRTEEGKQYKIYCRKRGSLEAPEEIVLDLNVLAEGQPFMGLGAYEVSDDGNYLIYSTDSTGFRVYALHVRDLRTGEVLPDTAEDVGSAAWASDNKTFFYTTKDSTKRPYRLRRHVLGGKEDDLVYEESDELFRISVSRTLSGAYLGMYAASHTTSEERYLPAGRPGDAWRLISPRKHEREYEFDHHGEHFYIRVNDRGRNFRLVSAPVSDPSEKNWKEIIPHDENVMLEDMDFFEGHYVLWQREDGIPQVRITDMRSGESHRMKFPEEVYTVFSSVNEEWKTTKLRYSYYSLVTPHSVMEYDIVSRKASLLKREEVLGGYDPKEYVTARLHATARDGTKVPISLVHGKAFKRDGKGPLLLVGYGSYGFPYPVTFSSARLSLLDRGVAMAIAHVRGGGEMGKKWHDDGRMHKKMNTFTDFIAVSEHLIEEGYTSKEGLIITGGSAGGLLMGAVTNLRPDLFKAVVSQVPFVDVINTMLDETMPLTVGEFEEWGNPKVKEDYEHMKEYCPYTNLEAGSYPATLIKTSFNDSQVMYWEPAKYVARMRALKTDDNPLLFVINMGGGHGGSSGRYDSLRETALDYAFILDQLGIKE